MLKLTPWLAACLIACAAVAHADDDDDDAKRALKLSGSTGLTGFRNMVDARTPGTLSFRGGLRYLVNVVDNDFRGALNATRKQRRHDITLYAGGSLLGLIDVAAKIPFVFDRQKTSINGLPDPRDDNDKGWGDVDLAGKISLELGPFDVAAYALGRLPTGEPEVRDLAELEYGVAASFTIFNHHLAAHGNLAGLQVEKGLTALRYRVGVSFVILDFDTLLLRVYGYGNGIEFEGRADSDIDLDFGAQAILFGFLSVELGTSVRLLDANFLDDSAKKALRGQGIFDRHFEDDGTWAIEFGVGIVF